jgi:hypothetical protein
MEIIMKINLLKVFAILTIFLGQITIVNASIIFESAENPTPEPTPNLGALGIDNNYFAFHRFFLNDTYHIDSVGGYFWGDTNRTIFGALIGLESEYDLPDSYDFTTPDILATTLITIGTNDGDYNGQVNTTLDTGWYAVAFGAGKFGADSIDSYSSSPGMPNLAVDLVPGDFPITAISEGSPWAQPQFVFQDSSARFFVTGSKASSVPEPSSLVLFFGGILMLLSSRILQRQNSK